MSFFDEVDQQNFSPAEQTYRNQTESREDYYTRNPAERYTPDNEEERVYLDSLAAQAPPAALPPPAASGGPVDPYARRRFQEAWAASPDHSPEALRALIASDPSYAGMTVSRDDKLTMPGYVEAETGIYRGPQTIDAIRDVRGANAWAWSGEGGPGGAGGGVPGGAGIIAPGGHGGAGEGGGGGGVGSSSFRAATSPLEVPAFTEEFKYDPWTRKFVAPRGEDVFNDPGYQFRLQEGQKALERSASRRGALNTGGTLKDVSAFGQGLASQEYGNAYGRAMNEYQSDYGDYLGGYERALGEYGQRAGIFGQNYQRGLQGFQSAQQAQEQQFGQGFRNRELGQRESEFGRNLGYNYANLGQQQNQFGQRLGYDYDTAYANAAMGGTGAANAEYTSGADATARGQAEAGGAWNQAIGSGANFLQQLALTRNPAYRPGTVYPGLIPG